MQTPDKFTRLARTFLIISAVLLVLTAGGKIIAVLGDSKILTQRSPLFSWFSNRYVLLGAAILELIVGSLVLSKRVAVFNKLLVVAWLGGLFLSYRTVLWWTGYTGSCSCLGHLSDALHLSQDEAGWITNLLVGYFLIGSIPLLYIWCRQLPHSPPTASPPHNARNLLTKVVLFSTCPLLLFCKCILGATALNSQAASGWLAEGETREISVQDGVDVVTSEWKFRFLSEECRWEMTIATRELGYAISTEILYDGTNITTLSAGGGTYQAQRFENQAARYQQSIPPFGGQAAFVWLALGSACELANQPREFREVVFTEFEDSRTVPVALSFREESPGLPERLLFLSSDRSQRTNAVYRALSYTNHASVSVPSRFDMDVLGRLGATIVRYEGSVTNVATDASVRAELALPPKTLVTDLRFAGNAGGRGFDYMTNKWLSSAEAKRRPEFRDETKMGPSGGALTAFLLLVCSLTLAIMLLFRARRPKPQP